MMNLSMVTGTELAEASTIAANQLRVFQMDASKTGEVADILAATANGSAQNLTDLGEALKTAAPFAAQAGGTLKDTSAALGVLANMGIRGSVDEDGEHTLPRLQHEQVGEVAQAFA